MWWGLPSCGRRGLAEPELVEGADGQRVEQAARRSQRHPGQLAGHEGPGLVGVAGQAGGQVGEPGVVAPGEHRAAEAAARRLAVDPGHRVPVAVVTVQHLVHDVVEVDGPLGVDQHVAGLHRDHLQGGVGHDPGEAHAAGRGPEEIGVRVGGDGVGPGRGDQGHRHDVRAEAAVDVVVLAVDVGGDRPADRHQAGARGHGYEPAERARTAPSGSAG